MGRIVWLSGNSGAGKTFTGDYLSLFCGFTHIDGDALSRSTNPADLALFANLVKAFDYWFESKTAPPDLWHLYYLRQCAASREAALIGDADVVISLTVYHRETRDFIRAQLPDLTFIVLAVSKPELLRRARVRFAEYAKAKNQPFDRAYETAMGLSEGTFSDAFFDSQTLSITRGLQPLEQDEVQCYEIDASDGAPWSQLHEILGLVGRPVPTQIEIDQIAAVNYERFKTA